MQAREELIRPLRFAGPGGELRGSYRWSARGYLSETRLAFGGDYIRNGYGHGAVPLHWDLSSAFGYRALARGGHTLHAGAAFFWQYAPVYYFSWDEEHLYWALNYDLGPMARWVWSIDPQNAVAAELSLPVLGFVSRPEQRRLNKIDDLTHASFWVREPHQHLQFSSLNEYVAIRARAHYIRRFKAWLSLRIGYELGYRWIAFPRTLQLLEQTLVAETVFQWGRRPHAAR